MKSLREFDRWQRHDAKTWSYQVFKKYSHELTAIWDSHILAKRFTYSGLKKVGATWEDQPSAHFDMNKVDWKKYKSLEDWSASYNLFDNWVNLSAVLTISSNLETYLASVISMSLDSDPGLLLGASKSIDGAYVLKRGRPGALKNGDRIDACVKGHWSSRLDAFENLFGFCPPEFRAAHSTLE